MTVHTHPVLEGPFVFLSVPTPSFWDQLKLKKTRCKRWPKFVGFASARRHAPLNITGENYGKVVQKQADGQYYGNHT